MDTLAAKLWSAVTISESDLEVELLLREPWLKDEYLPLYELVCMI